MSHNPIFLCIYSLQIYFVREFEARLTSLRQLKRSVPRVVNSNEFDFYARLRARLGFYEKFGNLFLGYCKRHNAYFLDLKHTNDVIRCPICDEAWLLKHQARQHFTYDFK